MRNPFQGVWNIMRFNWHFYVIASFMALVAFCLSYFLPSPYSVLAMIVWISIAITTLISLMASWFAYDRSNLYDLDWLKNENLQTGMSLLNVNAGFDELSAILEAKFKQTKLEIYDFYDPNLHTEVSIKRARAAYPPHDRTLKVVTKNLPGKSESFDRIFCFLSAHEIRDENERIQFFKELHRVLRIDGRIYIIEHLRDSTNFLAYTVGFFHFYSRSNWWRVFERASLKIHKEQKLNPFITLFITTKNGATS